MEFEEFDGLVQRAGAAHVGRTPPPGIQLFGGIRATEQDLATVEAALAVKLPQKYREVMKLYGGGQFLFVDLLPVLAHGAKPEDLETVNRDAAWREAFVAIAPVGTGDWWGFSVEDGICCEGVDFFFHEDGRMERGSRDFLEFLAIRGLRMRDA